MIRAAGIALALTLVGTADIQPASAGPARLIVGPGSNSCRLYTAFDASSAIEGQRIKKTFELFWIEGYLSRANMASDREMLTADPNIEALVDQYCAAHPDDNLATAADSIERLLYNASR